MPESGKALLFDIDGTLADTDALHLEAFNHVLGPRGHAFDHARFTKELQGFSNASISEALDRRTHHCLVQSLPPLGQGLGVPQPKGARILAPRLNPPHDQKTLQSGLKSSDGLLGEKEATFRRLVAGQIRPLPGLMALLARADRAMVSMVAVTNAPRLNAEMLLAGLGIMHRFKAVIIGDELAHGKPHPMPYLVGLRAVSAAPKLSLAFEDSRSGVQSAAAAGIATIGIRTSLSRDEMVAAGAVTTAKSFDDPELVRLVGTTMNW
jgi:HAD superfamily hydrolase (TIGR01509 family)